MSQLNNNNSDKNNSKVAFILIPILFVLVILGGLGLGLYLIISSFSSLDLEDISTENKEIASKNVNVVPDSKAKESLLDKTSAKPEIAKISNDIDKVNVKTEVKEAIANETEVKEVVANEAEVKQDVVTEAAVKETVATETEVKEVVATDAEAKQNVVTEAEVKETVATETEVKETVATETEVKEVVATDAEAKQNVVTEAEVKETVANETEVKEVVATAAEAKQDVVTEAEVKEVVASEKETNKDNLVQENVGNSDQNELAQELVNEPSIEVENSSSEIVKEETTAQDNEQLATVQNDEYDIPTITIDTNIGTDVEFDVEAIARTRKLEENKQQEASQPNKQKKLSFEERRKQFDSQSDRLYTYRELDQIVDLLKRVSANTRYNNDIAILDVRKDAGISYVYTYRVKGRTLNEWMRYDRKERETIITKKTCEKIRKDLGVAQKLKKLSYMAHEFIDKHKRVIAYVVVSKQSCNLD